ncbi:MAG: hypothetical protein HYX67_10840 [Candidatus Melainabacteria bacterium]|nr:hypothetical protein [Candidatus Melainabacteria bacterium]
MLSLQDHDPVLPKALAYLTTSQNEDGGWSTGPSEGKSDWCTGPALFALRTVAQKLSDKKGNSAYERGANFLSELPTELYNLGARIILGAIQGVKKTDESPRGWPWSRVCYHWVEPTSYNLYAFKLPQQTKYKDGFGQLVSRADKFLLENTCSTGGWNHGSHFSLGVNLPPYIVTTAEALLALQDFSDHKEIERAFDFLNANTEASEAGQKNSAMALAWMTLAFHAYGRDTTKLLSHLISIQKDDGSFGPNMMVTALCSMALNTTDGTNPFKMSADVIKSNSTKKQPDKKPT